MDAIEADEIQHVRFANEWLRRLTDAQPRSGAGDRGGDGVAAARSCEATGGDALKDIPTSDHDRGSWPGSRRREVTEVARLHRDGHRPDPRGRRRAAR